MAADTSIAGPPDILALRDRLVSPFCGLIRSFQRVHKDVLEPEVPYIWRAEIANHRFAATRDSKMVVASGKGLSPAAAQRSALGESVERYCALRFPTEGCKLAKRADLAGRSIDPRQLVLHTPEQLGYLPYASYDDALTLAWVEGQSLQGGERIWLLAQAVYLVGPMDSPTLFQSTSNGLAAGATASQAKLGALLEVVERDAFMSAWYHRLPPTKLEWRRHPNPQIVAIAQAYLRRGIAVELLLLPSDHDIPVVAALAFDEREGGIAAVVGLGADRSVVAAAASALLEVGQVRAALRIKVRDASVRKRRDELVENPSAVSELEDHDLLYTDRRMLKAFSPWRSESLRVIDTFPDERGEVDTSLAWVAARLSAVGAHAHVCDVTTPDIASLGLHVFRAIVEDFQPIHFGEREFRRGGRRFYELPMRLGLKSKAVTYADLNPLPHPLS